jgi:dynamin 1-like protein
MKELGANGTDTPADEEEENAATERTETITVRKAPGKGSRSLSPAVHDTAAGGIAAALNGPRSSSPSRFNGQALGGAKDSFLNYFFGKDGAIVPGAALPNANIGRHVSQSVEPTFSQSIRRPEERALRSPMQPIRADESLDFTGGAKGTDLVSRLLCSDFHIRA